MSMGYGEGVEDVFFIRHNKKVWSESIVHFYFWLEVEEGFRYFSFSFSHSHMCVIFFIYFIH